MKINRSKEDALTHDALTKILEYCPDSGIFTYKVARGSKAAGSEAGYTHKSGYRCIEINGKEYLAHRLAWYYCFLEWPTDNIDHINRDKLDNSLDNLREASQEENMWNRSISKNNTSGFLGVSPYKNKWRASFIERSGKPKYLGYFNTPEEASIAYIAYKQRYIHENTTNC